MFNRFKERCIYWWDSGNTLSAIIGIILIVCCVTGKCEEIKVDHDYVVGMHVASVHSTPRDNVAGRDWNNANVGVYFRRDNVVVGTYYNSIRKESFYAGYVQPITDNVDIIVGAVSGYNGPGYRAKPVMPMLIPSAHWDITSKFGIRANLAIGVGKNSATALNFALEYKL